MGAFQEKYTDQQRDALAHAYEDRGVRPAARVVALAARGELEHDGVRLEPFEANPNTVRTEAIKLRRRRAGTVKSQLAAMPAQDATEALRRRYVNAADALLEAFERKAKRDPNSADPKRLQEIGRCIREAAAIPGPDNPRPAKPGQRDAQTGEHNGSRTRSGLAAQIEAAHKRQSTHETTTDNAGPEPTGARSTEQDETVQTEGSPGVARSEEVAALPMG